VRINLHPLRDGKPDADGKPRDESVQNQVHSALLE
jgi:hypothetical protein